MDDWNSGIDVAGGFGAVPLEGKRFTIHIPDRDRNGAPVDRDAWVNRALRLLAKVGGGAAALPPMKSAWANPDSGELLIEERVAVYSFVPPEAMKDRMGELSSFLKTLGRETNQAAVAFEWDGKFFTVEDFD